MPADLTSNEVAELACTYAALILHDDKVPITAEKIKTILGASGVDVPAFWPTLFAKVLASRNVDDIILNSGGGGPAPAPTTGGGGHGGDTKKDEGKKDAKKEDKKEEKKKKEEEKEEEDGDMGFGLFD